MFLGVSEIIFGITAFLSSFLLFSVQPMISKFMLPYFGGSNLVWATSMMVFQSLLLGGYYYAYKLDKQSKNLQVISHVLLISLCLLVLIITTNKGVTIVTPKALISKENVANTPFFEIVKIVFASVGTFFFLLSATSIVLQNCFKNIKPDSEPYWIYGISNFSSLLAIASYPFLIEPNMTLGSQSQTWTYLFIVFAVFMILSLILTILHKTKPKTIENNEATQTTKKQKGIWLGIGFITSVVLQATTSSMTQDITPFPFLWLLPLGLYLISFIFTFNPSFKYRNTIYTFGLFSLGSFQYIIINFPFFLKMVYMSLVLFCSLMIWNGELFKKRPENKKDLSTFYLFIALGSALGSFFSSIVSTLLFKGFWEYPISFTITILFCLILLRNQNSWLKTILRKTPKLNLVILIPISMAILYGPYFIFSELYAKKIYKGRNFYGVLSIKKEKVIEGVNRQTLYHGSTLHGAQFEREDLRESLFYYYTENSGVAYSLKYGPSKKNVAIIGLGTGALAKYCTEGDRYTFFEINSQVIEVANKHFSFLDLCRKRGGSIDTELGDARLTLERREDRETFDVLVVDAFNDDAIPTHLLTKEAFEIYERALKKDGIIAVHISNRFFDLSPLVKKQGEGLNMEAIYLKSYPDKIFEDQNIYKIGFVTGSWILLTRNKEFINLEEFKERKLPIQEFKHKIWTDDFSNLLSVLDK